MVSVCVLSVGAGITGLEREEGTADPRSSKIPLFPRRKLYPMRRLFLTLVLCVFGFSAHGWAQTPSVREQYTKREVTIPMRDGVKLFTAIYSPKDTSKKAPFLMMRTPYSCSPYGS